MRSEYLIGGIVAVGVLGYVIYEYFLKPKPSTSEETEKAQESERDAIRKLLELRYKKTVVNPETPSQSTQKPLDVKSTFISDIQTVKTVITPSDTKQPYTYITTRPLDYITEQKSYETPVNYVIQTAPLSETKPLPVYGSSSRWLRLAF